MQLYRRLYLDTVPWFDSLLNHTINTNIVETVKEHYCTKQFKHCRQVCTSFLPLSLQYCCRSHRSARVALSLPEICRLSDLCSSPACPPYCLLEIVWDALSLSPLLHLLTSPYCFHCIGLLGPPTRRLSSLWEVDADCGSLESSSPWPLLPLKLCPRNSRSRLSALVSWEAAAVKMIVDKLSTKHALSSKFKSKTSNTLFIELFSETTERKIGSIVRLKSCSTQCL